MVQKITLLEREKIFEQLSKKVSISKIAEALNRHRSNIYREINRLSKESYSPSLAQKDAKEKAKNSRKKSKFSNKELEKYIVENLYSFASPDQISNRLKVDFSDDLSMRISPETIYQFIYKKKDPDEKLKFIKYLRQRKKKRYARKRKNEKRGKIPNMISIKERSAKVEKRIEKGHWEGDHVVGQDHRTAIATLVERSSRYTIIVPLIKNKSSAETVGSFIQVFNSIPKELRKSLTYDRGKEMTLHEIFTKTTHIPVYFADPHSPWQRGTNENTNGLIRQFFPKGTDFSKYRVEDYQKVQDLLNNRPRKVLGYMTPNEKLSKII